MDATVANAQAALDSQLAYWESYSANVETLKNTSAEPTSASPRRTTRH